METFGIGVKPVKVSVFVFHITLQRGIAYLDIDLITATHNVTDGPFEICGSDFITMWRIHRDGAQIKQITIDIKNFIPTIVQKMRMVTRWDRDRIG